MQPLNRRFQRPAPGAQDQTIRAMCQITGTVLAKFNEPLAWPGSACKYSEAVSLIGESERKPFAEGKLFVDSFFDFIFRFPLSLHSKVEPLPEYRSRCSPPVAVIGFPCTS